MKGFSFIELLIATSLLTTCLLGTSGMCIIALNETHTAYLKSQAANQLVSMLSRLKACKSTAARHAEFTAWNQENAQVLLQGHGQYTCKSPPHCQASITWKQGNQWKSLSTTQH